MIKRRKLSPTEKFLFIVPLQGIAILTLQGPLSSWWNRYGMVLPWGSKTFVRDMRFSADNKQLAVVYWNHRDKNGRLDILDSSTQQVKQSLFFTGPTPITMNYPSAHWSPDGRHVVVDSGEALAIYNLADGREVLHRNSPQNTWEYVSNWTSGTLVEITRKTVNRGANLVTSQKLLADISTRQVTPQGKPQTKPHNSPSQPLILSDSSPNQNYELYHRFSSISDERLELWTRQKKRLVQTLSDKYERAFFINNNLLAASIRTTTRVNRKGDDRFRIDIFQRKNANKKWPRIEQHTLEKNELLRVHLKNPRFITTSQNGTLRLRDTRTWQVVQVVPGSSNDVINYMKLSPNEKYIAYTQGNQTRVQIVPIQKH